MRLSAQEKKWQQEDDARTLARAQEIIGNKNRHNGTISVVKKMAIENEKRIKAMKKVAAKKRPLRKKVIKKTIREPRSLIENLVRLEQKNKKPR